MAFVEVNGVRLHVVDEGTGEPILFLHGFTGTAAGWTRIASALAPHRRTIRVDLLGHGLSCAPTDSGRYSLTRAAEDLVALLDALDVDECVVAGYSMGGRTALHLALAAPRRVRGLILESASPGIADPAEREARRKADEALADRIEREGIAWFVAYWESLPLFATQKSLPHEVQTAVRRERLAQSPLGLAGSLRGAGAGAQEDLLPRLPELEMPVLLIAGELDEKYCRIARAMHGVLARSRLCIVEGAGHNVHLERPDAYIRAVEAFLEELPATVEVETESFRRSHVGLENDAKEVSR